MHSIQDSALVRRSQVGRQLQGLLNRSGALSDTELAELRHFTDEALELERDVKSGEQRKAELAYEQAFASYLRNGWTNERTNNGLNGAQKALLTDRRILINERLKEARDMISGQSGAGIIATSGAGIFVPVGFFREVSANLKLASDLFDPTVTRVVPTPDSGGIIPFPTVDDVSVQGELLTESTQVTATDVASISSVNLRCWKFSSRMIKISRELAEDQNVDLSALLAELFAQRIARAAAGYLSNGSGFASAQPRGWLQDAQSAGVAVGANANDGVSGANSIGSLDVSALITSIDPLWRRAGAAFMCHDNTLQRMRAQLDKSGRRLWPELGSDSPMLEGFPVYCDPTMDTLQTTVGSPPTTKVVLAFGSWKQFLVRIGPLSVLRLVERFSDMGQVGFICFHRLDSALLQSSAIRTLSTVF